MAAKVKINPGGMGELLKSAGVRGFVTERAERVLSAAQSSAPVGETGDYKASLHIEQDTTDRAVVRVVADVSYARIVEANTGTLSRALDSAGGS